MSANFSATILHAAGNFVTYDSQNSFFMITITRVKNANFWFAKKFRKCCCVEHLELNHFSQTIP